MTINDLNLIRVLAAAGKAYQEILDEDPFADGASLLAKFMLAEIVSGTQGGSVGLVVVDKVVSDLRLAAQDLQDITSKLLEVPQNTVDRGGWKLSSKELIAEAEKEFKKLCSSES